MKLLQTIVNEISIRLSHKHRLRHIICFYLQIVYGCPQTLNVGEHCICRDDQCIQSVTHGQVTLAGNNNCLYYTLRFYFPYVSLLAQPFTIFVYGPARYLHYFR
jgi:hypothetical protein